MAVVTPVNIPVGLVSLFRSQDRYRRLLTGQAIRAAGNWNLLILLTYDAWVHSSPGRAGTVLAARAMPALFSAWASAPLCRRFGPRRPMTVALTIETVASLLVATSLAGYSRGIVMEIAALALGVAAGLHTAAFQTAVGDVVPSELQAAAAVGLGWSYDSGKVLGAAVAGAAVSMESLPLGCLAAATMSAIGLMSVRRYVPGHDEVEELLEADAQRLAAEEQLTAPGADSPPAPRTDWHAVTLAGASIAWSSLLAGQILLVLVAASGSGASIEVLLGPVFGAFAVGAIVGSGLVARMGVSWQTMTAALLAAGAAITLGALGSSSVAVGSAFLYGIGVAGYFQGGRGMVARHTRTSDQPRAYALLTMAFLGSGAIGSLFFGVLAGWVGPRHALLISAITLLVPVLACGRAAQREQSLRRAASVLIA